MVNYRYVLPGDWAQVRLDPLEPGAVKAVTDRMFGDISDEVTRVRVSGWATSQLRKSLEALAEVGAWAAYLPAENPVASPVRPMIVTRPFDAEESEADPMELLLALAAEAGEASSPIQPAGMVGLKIREPEDPAGSLLDSLSMLPEDIRELADEDQLLAAAAEQTRLVRRVRYVIGVPEDAERWMHVEASVSCALGEEAGEALDAVEEFFDAWVETLSWEETEDE